LDGWQNRYFSSVIFIWALWLGAKRGDSFVGVFNRRVDRIFCEVIGKWRTSIKKMGKKIKANRTGGNGVNGGGKGL
jgi:hypothetical protein